MAACQLTQDVVKSHISRIVSVTGRRLCGESGYYPQLG